MRHPSLISLGLALGAGLSFGQDAPTDAALDLAFGKLAEGVRSEAVEWFCAECEALPTYQRGLIDHVLKGLDRDPLGWPEAPAPQFYDSAHHTPGQVIDRRFVDASRGSHQEVVARMLRKVPQRELVPAYGYDWALGSVVEVGVLRDVARVAHNAARGIEPRVDLVEALVTMQLDTGKIQKVAAAFAHAYADRTGNAYREVTLYDAWASGAKMEMPDVECLGIVHDLAGDWKRWVAPVAANQQDPLYEWIGERFVPYFHERGLRTALARSYLLAAPAQRDGYGAAQTRLHAFWERASSDPKALARDLPDGQAWADWLEAESAKVENDLPTWQRAEARAAALRESQDFVRRTWVGILRELGAL